MPARANYRSEQVSNGTAWYAWDLTPPPFFETLEFKRWDTDERWIGLAHNLPPTFKISDVYWRPLNESGTLAGKNKERAERDANMSKAYMARGLVR
jgi:hypothetical protein